MAREVDGATIVDTVARPDNVRTEVHKVEKSEANVQQSDSLLKNSETQSDRPEPRRQQHGLANLYTRSTDFFQTLLRSIGLKITTIRKAPEAPKVVLKKSGISAAARCAVHIVPAVVSILLVWLNLRGYFIGNELQGVEDNDDAKMGLLQVAAKIQELLIMSSMGTMVFDLIRKHVMFQNGLPLGLLVSGFEFNSPSYFVSAEFAAGVSARAFWGKRERWREVFTLAFFSRVVLVMLVVVGGILGLLAGPAAAVLMIPSQQDWLNGGATFWLNGTKETLWPTKLDANYYADAPECLSDTTAQLGNPNCPAAGFPALRNHYASWWNILNSGFQIELQDSHVRKLMYYAPAIAPGTNTYSWTTFQAGANMQDRMRDYHINALGYLIHQRFSDSWEISHLRWASKVTYKIQKLKMPLVRTGCSWQPDLNITASGPLEVGFYPRMDVWDVWWKDDARRAAGVAPPNKTVDIRDALENYVLERKLLGEGKTLEDADSFDDLFNTARQSVVFPIDLKHRNDSLGIVMLLKDPWTQARYGDARLDTRVIACTVDAGWINATSYFETDTWGDLVYEYTAGRSRNLAKVELPDRFDATNGQAHIDAEGRTEKIQLSPSWWDVLSPVIPEDYDLWTRSKALNGEGAGVNMTTAEHLLQQMWKLEEEPVQPFENLISMMIADGLSRTGSMYNRANTQFFGRLPAGRVWGADSVDQSAKNDEIIARTLVRQGDPVETFPEPEIVKGHSHKLIMKARYAGYAMYVQDWFSYICCAALLTHALLALLHTIYIVFYAKMSSAAWSSMLEMLVLAKVSEPPPPAKDILKNTSAGIGSWGTMRLMAWIEAKSDVEDQQGGKELRLRVEREGGEGRDSDLKVKDRQAYS